MEQSVAQIYGPHLQRKRSSDRNDVQETYDDGLPFHSFNIFNVKYAIVVFVVVVSFSKKLIIDIKTTLQKKNNNLILIVILFMNLN